VFCRTQNFCITFYKVNLQNESFAAVHLLNKLFLVVGYRRYIVALKILPKTLQTSKMISDMLFMIEVVIEIYFRATIVKSALK